MKATIRKQAKQARDGIGPLFRNQKSTIIHEQLLGEPEVIAAQHILLYHSTQSEVETEALIDKLLTEGKSIYLPRAESGELTICKIEHRDDLEKGAYGIHEPKLACPEYTPEKLDCIIIPGLAFDENGNRMGYGKGYYDKLLKKTSASKIALAFEEQIIDDVPAEAHDVIMDKIVTDERTITP